MLKSQEISPIEVIRSFYISDKLLKEMFDSNEELTVKEVEAKLKVKVKFAEKLSQNELIGYLAKRYAIKFDNYLNSTWELKNVSLSDCGVWPRMGDFPEEMTYGNVVDTANCIKIYLKNKSLLNWKMEKLLYIENIMKYSKTILKYMPIIVFEDNLIRKNRFLNPKNIEKYKECMYDIDDGSHRCVTFVLMGLKTTKAYVGKQRYKSDLMYF